MIASYLVPGSCSSPHCSSQMGHIQQPIKLSLHHLIHNLYSHQYLIATASNWVWQNVHVVLPGRLKPSQRGPRVGSKPLKFGLAFPEQLRTTVSLVEGEKKKLNPRWGLKKHLHVKKRLKLHRYKVENNSNVVLWLKELVIGVVWSSLPNTFRAASLPSSSHINTLLSLTPRPTYCIIAWAGCRMERIGMFPFFFFVEHLEWMIDAGGARSERCNHGLTSPEP